MPDEENKDLIPDVLEGDSIVDWVETPTYKYDPQPEREKVRGRIALGLVGLLAAVLLLIFIGIFIGVVDSILLKENISLLFILVSNAVAFYLGSKK